MVRCLLNKKILILINKEKIDFKLVYVKKYLLYKIHGQLNIFMDKNRRKSSPVVSINITLSFTLFRRKKGQ